MRIVRPPLALRKLYPDLTWRRSIEERKLFLTFDDGPVPVATDFVLDTLRDFHIKGTFFCVGENVLKNPRIYHRILNEGHAVGNHTHNHLKGWQTSDGVYLKNVADCELALLNGKNSGSAGLRLEGERLKEERLKEERLDGVVLEGEGEKLETGDVGKWEKLAKPLFRPPYGRIKRSQMKALLPDYQIIMWDVLSYDYDKRISPEQCLKHVVSKVRPGSIVVFHDHVKAFQNLSYALPRALEILVKDGWTFGVL